MEQQPLVSIIVPVYNAKNHIARCIESIRRQTYQNLQIIVLNDGSKDVSLEVCRMYAKVDKRILLVDIMHDTDNHYFDVRQTHDTRMEYVRKIGRHGMFTTVCVN